MLLHLLLLIAGFALVIAGADALVRGAASLAKRLAVSDLVIGLTVVAFGTSAPELVVNVIASFEGDEGIVLGNIIGSNLFNLLVILAMSALIRPLAVYRRTVRLEIPYSLLTVFLLAAAANDTLLDGQPSLITRSDALQMLTFFAIFLYYTFWQMQEKVEIDLGVRLVSKSRILLWTVGGLAFLFVGGRLVVHEAVWLARYFEVSEALIGLTLVSGGTSLPELATSVVAALRHRDNIAVGNVVGSNIFNTVFILPMSALVRDIPFPESLNLDLALLFVGSALLLWFMFSKKRYRLDRGPAAVLLILYVVYLAFILHRG